tara:strand:+ start:1580 stop:2164 length:585 start_codon:yes stop_codon:yes gene_type:complete
MNYNLYLFGDNINKVNNYATELLKYTDFSKVISFYDIHYTMGGRSLSKHLLSKSLFYEDIENNFNINNIIIPEQVHTHTEYNMLKSTIIEQSKDMKNTSIICVMKDTWSDIQEEKNSIVQYFEKHKLHNHSVDFLNQEVSFRYTQGKLETLYSGSLLSGLVYKIYGEDDTENNIVKFTDFCIKNNLKEIIYQGE